VKVIEPLPLDLPKDHVLQGLKAELLKADYSDIILVHQGKATDEQANSLAFTLANTIRRQVVLLCNGEEISAISREQLKQLI